MLFQELGKLKRTSIMTSIVLMAMGVVMVICPERYVMSLVDVLGYAMLVFATVMVLDFFASNRVLLNYAAFTVALIIAILGISVLAFSENIMQIIGLLFGILLIVSGLFDIVNAWLYARRSRRRGWWLLVVLSALQMVLGLMILINPWWNSPRSLFVVIGLALLFSSVVGMVRLFYLWPIRGE